MLWITKASAVLEGPSWQLPKLPVPSVSSTLLGLLLCCFCLFLFFFWKKAPEVTVPLFLRCVGFKKCQEATRHNPGLRKRESKNQLHWCEPCGEFISSSFAPFLFTWASVFLKGLEGCVYVYAYMCICILIFRYKLLLKTFICVYRYNLRGCSILIVVITLLYIIGVKNDRLLVCNLSVKATQAGSSSAYFNNETAIYSEHLCLCADGKDGIMYSSGLFEVHTEIKLLTQLHLDCFPPIWQRELSWALKQFVLFDIKVKHCKPLSAT